MIQDNWMFDLQAMIYSRKAELVETTKGEKEIKTGYIQEIEPKDDIGNLIASTKRSPKQGIACVLFGLKVLFTFCNLWDSKMIKFMNKNSPDLISC